MQVNAFNEFWSKNWQWVIFAGVALMGNVPTAWKWWRRRAAQSWPVVQGRIDAVDVPSDERKVLGLTLTSSRNRPSKARISYSYSWSGETFRGVYTREFGRVEEASDFLRDLQGQPVEVHVSRTKPEQSVLSEKSLETLLQARSPAPPVPEGRLPSWLRPLLWPLISVAVIGFVLSAWIHVQAIEGRMPDSSAWGLHVGIFVVFIPAVIVAQRRVGNTSRKDYWKTVLRGAPEWMKYLNYALVGYATVNFFWCMRFLPTGHHHEETTPTMWRLFSGHWMVFYFAAFSVLYATIANQRWGSDTVVSAAPTGEHCANGHLISKGDLYCAICGGTRAY